MERVDPHSLLIKVVKVLDNLKIPYIVTGGIAVLIYGRPRFTEDIESIFRISGKKLNIEYIKKQALKLDIADVLSKFSK